MFVRDLTKDKMKRKLGFTGMASSDYGEGE